jgi:hypothetical protein
MDDLDKEREGCKSQAFIFAKYAQEAKTEAVHDLWRDASHAMQMASLCLAPDGIAKHRSEAARLARAAQYEEQRPAQPAAAQSDPHEEERKRKAAQAVINEKRERTHFERLKKKFGE